MRFIVPALLLLSAAPALAQSAAPNAAAAAQVVELFVPAAQQRAAIEGQIAAVRRGDAFRQMFAGNPAFRAEAAKNQPRFNNGLARAGGILADAVGPVQREMADAQRRALIDGFARRFTPAELASIAAFLRTPAGQKLVREQGQLQAEAARGVQQRYAARMQAAEAAARPKVQAELAKLVPQPAGQKK